MSRSSSYPVLSLLLGFALSTGLHAQSAPTDLSDAEVAHVAVTANSIDIDLAKLALSRTSNPDVKQFANTMITDHGAVNAQASALATKLGVTPADNQISQSLLKGAAEARATIEPLEGKVLDQAYQMTPHDEWDYDGVNENVLFESGGKKLLAHFDRNGIAYTIDRTNGKVIVANAYGPINWAKSKGTGTPVEGIVATGVPVKDPAYGTTAKYNTEGICPASIGFKDQQPAAYSPLTGWFYVPASNICMDYEGVEVKYTAGQPYVGAIVRMFPGPGGNRGRFIAWDPMSGTMKWEIKEPLAAYGGALTTAGGLVFYGTMEGWLKAVDQKSGKVLWQFKTASGIIGNPMSFQGPDKKQYVAVYSGIGGWAGIGVAAGIGAEDPTAGLGAIGAFGDAGQFSTQGGVLTVFGL